MGGDIVRLKGNSCCLNLSGGYRADTPSRCRQLNLFNFSIICISWYEK